MIRTPDEVKKDFKKKGISISAWSLANGFSPNLVFEVLSGRRNPTRGQTHNIAVTLGLKEGEIIQESDISTAV